MTAPNQPPDLVSNRDIYIEVIKMQGLLSAVVERGQDHESRIRALEKWRWSLPGSYIIGLGSAAMGLYALLKGH